jgi:hypothetical protein
VVDVQHYQGEGSKNVISELGVQASAECGQFGNINQLAGLRTNDQIIHVCQAPGRHASLQFGRERHNRMTEHPRFGHDDNNASQNIRLTALHHPFRIPLPMLLSSL